MKPLTSEEKAERSRVMTAAARQASDDYAAEQARIESNSLRLKALRLERDAQIAAAPPPPKPVRKRSVAAKK
jgi:hypothetical protein